MKKFACVSIGLLLLITCLSGCINPSGDYVSFIDVQYKDVSGVDPTLLSLDIYVPNVTIGYEHFSINPSVIEHFTEDPTLQSIGLEGMPVMIWVHGGGWKIGDKSNRVDDKINLFTGSGWILVGVNYRLSPSSIPWNEDDFDPDRIMYPTHNEDVASAIAWVSENIASYGGCLANISLMGHSAGASIVAALGTNETFLEDVGLGLDSLRSVVCLDTEGYNVTHQTLGSSWYLSRLYKNAFGLDPKVWFDASPCNHIEGGKNIPSFFVVTRGSDERVMVNENFVSALNASGVETVLIYAMEYSHAEVNQAIGQSGETVIMPALIEFLGLDVSSNLNLS